MPVQEYRCPLCADTLNGASILENGTVVCTECGELYAEAEHGPIVIDIFIWHHRPDQLSLGTGWTSLALYPTLQVDPPAIFALSVQCADTTSWLQANEVGPAEHLLGIFAGTNGEEGADGETVEELREHLYEALGSEYFATCHEVEHPDPEHKVAASALARWAKLSTRITDLTLAASP